MITRKDWNNLSPITRRRAAKMVFFNMGEEFQNNMEQVARLAQQELIKNNLWDLIYNPNNKSNKNG